MAATVRPALSRPRTGIETARGELQDLEDAGADAITSGENPFEESNEKARELGLDECGNES
ncbi:MAG: hypothetical protein M3323_14545 [Actinomycetota bacterium]|nr:hypothetical protein [Actinomycetota bacterium]